MSLVAVWSVFCDVGSNWCLGWVGETDTRADAMKVARAEGWKNTRRNGWTCPKCRYEVKERVR